MLLLWLLLLLRDLEKLFFFLKARLDLAVDGVAARVASLVSDSVNGKSAGLLASPLWLVYQDGTLFRVTFLLVDWKRSKTH